VDIAQAEAFLTLAEELHFGRASQRLHVSQPRVSRLIAGLERQVGAPLFERTSRRVLLTPLGEQFRDELGVAYTHMQAALEHAHAAAREAAGTLRIGFTNTTGGPPLSRLVAAFETRYPDCQVCLREVAVADPYTALRAGEIDVLVNWLVLEEPDLTAGPAIDTQDRVVALALRHPLAARDSVSAEDLAGQPVAQFPPTFPPTMYEAFVLDSMIPRGPVVQSITETWALVAQGMIVHLTVASMARQHSRDDITFIPVTGLPPLRLGLIWRTACCNARIRALATAARSVNRPGTWAFAS
jgi:DNA-binding transcriptional LysR family regulator